MNDEGRVLTTFFLQLPYWNLHCQVAPRGQLIFQKNEKRNSVNGFSRNCFIDLQIRHIYLQQKSKLAEGFHFSRILLAYLRNALLIDVA